MNGLTQIIGSTTSTAMSSTTPGRTALAAKNTAMPAAKTVLPALALGAVGAYMWRKHSWLGLFTGMALGEAAYPLLKGSSEEKTQALVRVGVEGVAVAGSLYIGKKYKHPVLGYLGGALAGAGVAMFVKKKEA